MILETKRGCVIPMTHPLTLSLKPKNQIFFTLNIYENLFCYPINVCPNYLGKLNALVISAISSWLMPSGSNPMHFESI